MIDDNEKLKSTLLIYWEAYGGWKAIFGSIYFWLAILITIICTNFWLKTSNWYDTPLSGLPSLLGFSLGGYAVWLSVGNEKVKKILSHISAEKSKYSDFIVVNATFVHFIMLQILAYIYLLCLKANPLSIFTFNGFYNSSHLLSLLKILNSIMNLFGFLLFIYSVLAMLAAIFAIFNISTWTDEINKSEDL